MASSARKQQAATELQSSQQTGDSPNLSSGKLKGNLIYLTQIDRAAGESGQKEPEAHSVLGI